MSKGLDQLLQRIVSEPSRLLIDRYLQLLGDLSEDEGRTGRALDLAEALLAADSLQALRIALMVHQTSPDNLRAYDLMIAGLLQRGRHAKAELLSRDREQLALALAEEQASGQRSGSRPLSSWTDDEELELSGISLHGSEASEVSGSGQGPEILPLESLDMHLESRLLTQPPAGQQTAADGELFPWHAAGPSPGGPGAAAAKVRRALTLSPGVIPFTVPPQAPEEHAGLDNQAPEPAPEPGQGRQSRPGPVVNLALQQHGVSPGLTADKFMHLSVSTAVALDPQQATQALQDVSGVSLSLDLSEPTTLTPQSLLAQQQSPQQLSPQQLSSQQAAPPPLTAQARSRSTTVASPLPVPLAGPTQTSSRSWSSALAPTAASVRKAETITGLAPSRLAGLTTAFTAVPSPWHMDSAGASSISQPASPPSLSALNNTAVPAAPAQNKSTLVTASAPVASEASSQPPPFAKEAVTVVSALPLPGAGAALFWRELGRRFGPLQPPGQRLPPAFWQAYQEQSPTLLSSADGGIQERLLLQILATAAASKDALAYEGLLTSLPQPFTHPVYWGLALDVLIARRQARRVLVLIRSELRRRPVFAWAQAAALRLDEVSKQLGVESYNWQEEAGLPELLRILAQRPRLRARGVAPA